MDSENFLVSLSLHIEYGAAEEDRRVDGMFFDYRLSPGRFQPGYVCFTLFLVYDGDDRKC